MARYIYTFPLCDGFTIPGSTHGLRTPNLFYQWWDNGHPRRKSFVGPALEVDSETFDVYATFLQPLTGTLILSDGKGT